MHQLLQSIVFAICLFSVVNDLLSKETELKVRYMPKPDGEVLGYLQRGHVIECLAVIGDWLQVRYEQEDTAWVRWRITTPQSRAAQAAAQAEAEAATNANAASSVSSASAATKRVSFDPVKTFRSFSAPMLGFGDSGNIPASAKSTATHLSGTTGTYIILVKEVNKCLIAANNVFYRYIETAKSC